MIIEGIEGSVDLRQMFKELNAEFFGGSIPNIKLEWSGRLKNSVGMAHVRYKGVKVRRNTYDKWLDEIPQADIEILPNTLRIQISKSFDLQLIDVKAIMLHEMVHIQLYTKRKIGGHHGTSEFDGWINKLRDQSGYNIPFKETEFKKSPKLKAKEGLVMIVFDKQGKFGISIYSKNFLMKQWMVFTEVMARLLNRSSKVNKLEIYKITHPIVSSAGSIRSIKLSWKMTDEETVKEIQRKGKIFFWGDKQAVTIHPIIFGETKYIVKKGEKITMDKDGQITNVV